MKLLLSFILALFALPSFASVCDLDGNGSVDTADLTILRSRIGQSVSPGSAGDANGDGRITVNDVAACSAQCTNARCAPSSAKPAASAAKPLDPRTLVVAQPCDVNNDGAINVLDLLAIRSMIGFVVTPGAAGDANSDGVISMADYRACTLRCTNANCSV